MVERQNYLIPNRPTSSKDRQKELEERLTALEIELKRGKLKIKKDMQNPAPASIQTPATLSVPIPEPAIYSPDNSFDDWKDQIDAIRMELKRFFAEKRDIQEINYKLDTFASEGLNKQIEETVNKKLSDIRSDFATLREEMTLNLNNPQGTSNNEEEK